VTKIWTRLLLDVVAPGQETFALPKRWVAFLSLWLYSTHVALTNASGAATPGRRPATRFRQDQTFGFAVAGR
jgi:hypothetical protein